ncbi:unnamed protein product [Euphydryas editha]|uniref:Proton-coupled folate transporter n=1 Tax=Euphydryas editha TaxID=104508 RepID=A0AAU9V8Q0_EUPED|nr:unnamed protein product [Euphydryas editha]
MAAEKQNINSENEKIREEYNEADPLNETKEARNEEKKKTFKENCSYVMKNITVEPTMFLFIFGIVIGILTSQNLNLEKACRVNLNFTTEICDGLKAQTLGEQNVYERDVQRLVASAMAWRTYITATIPCLLALFVGSWSDKTGHRKIFIIAPIIGQMLININAIINTYFFYQLRLEVIVFSEAILDGLSGSWCVTFLTIFSYISAITTNENRTFRMGLINFSLTVGFPIGMGLSGILLKSLGYYGCYGLVTGIHFINLMYIIFILKDPERTPEQKMHDGKGAKHYIRLFFDFKNIKDTLKVLFKKDLNNSRWRLSILVVVVCILFGPFHGEISVLYISTRYRFNWDEVIFSLFQAYNMVLHTTGTIISITVFSKYLGWHDSVLGIISTISKIASSFIYCFAPNSKIFFIAPVVDLLNGTSLLALKSTASKLVSPDEFGKYIMCKITKVCNVCNKMNPLPLKIYIVFLLLKFIKRLTWQSH